MKLSKITYVAWVFFALMLASSTLMAQGWRQGNKRNYQPNQGCLHGISNLSEKQQKQILGLEESHQIAMAELRTKRRSTTNAVEKSEIRTEMLKKVEAHKGEVKGLLSKEQQQQYEQLRSYGSNGCSQTYWNGRGNVNFQGRGNGNLQFACTNQRAGNHGGRQGFSKGNGNFRNSNNGRGNGNRNFQRGKGGYYQNYSCNHNTACPDTSGFKKIEEKKF